MFGIGVITAAAVVAVMLLPVFYCIAFYPAASTSYSVHKTMSLLLLLMHFLLLLYCTLFFTNVHR